MVRVCRSTIVDAPIDAVWGILRDFNGHDRWHPSVAESEIEGGEPTDMIGAVRHFRLAEGGELREQLLNLSDRDHTFSYCILEAPFPLMNYVATVRLKPVTDGNRTFWEWTSTFLPPKHRQAELVRMVAEGIYEDGFAAVRALLDRGRTGAFVRADRSTPPLDAVPSVVPLGGSGDVRAIVVDRYGGPDVLQLRTVALPAPSPGEVRIRHSYAGVNFIDVYCRTGYFSLLRPPGIPGMEAAGIVEAIGPGVSGFVIGERVAYACPPVGAYSEARNMAPDLLVPLSHDISDETAAAVLLKGVTASFLLHDVHPVQSGETVVVHAAAGGVGQLLVQWAHHLGARVIASVSSDEKAAIARRLGAEDVVIYTREDFAEAVMRLTDGHGADVVYDAVGTDTFASSLASLGSPGHLVSFGQASGPIGNWDIGDLAAKSITLSRPNYGHYTDTPERLQPHIVRLFSALRNKIVTVGAPRIYELADAAHAHQDIEARRTTGSILLRT
jgi:NADPH:quinone reductase